MTLKISGFSTALFSTWFFVEPFRLLLDCGDGASALLGQKSRKIRHVALTHADRDHLTGLLQFNQLNGRDGLTFHYPSNCGSFPALRAFFDRFDPHVGGDTEWRPFKDGAVIPIEKDLELVAQSNGHKPAAPGETKSVGFRVYRTKKKLKPEFAGLSGAELGELARTHGSGHIQEHVRELKLSFSGDAPIEDATRWRGSPVLIHEATFLNLEDAAKQRSQHSNLPDLLALLKDAEVDRLILSHFSSRYRAPEIREAVHRCASKVAYPRPIWAILPHEYVDDILARDPIWTPTVT